MSLLLWDIIAVILANTTSAPNNTKLLLLLIWMDGANPTSTNASGPAAAASISEFNADNVLSHY